MVKKKIGIALGFVVILGGLGMSLFSTPSENALPTSPSSKDLYETISHHLQLNLEGRGVAVTMIIPGAKHEDDVWQFTGSLKEDRSDKPFYGALKLRCDEFQNDSCWELETLVVNGHAVLVIPQDTIESAEVGMGVSSVIKEDVAEGNNSSEQTVSAPSQSPDMKADSQVVESSVSTPQYWKTKSDNVNARHGPGTKFPIAIQIPSYVKLTMVREENGWGLFEYAGKGGAKGRVWISMSHAVPFEKEKR